MLTNTTLQEPKVDNNGGKVMVSVYIDKWSPNKMQHTKSKILGDFLVMAWDVLILLGVLHGLQGPVGD